MSPEIVEMKESLVGSMTRYLQGAGTRDPGYTIDHVEECARILDAYLAEIFSQHAGSQTNESIVCAVKTAVLALNQLNEVTGGGLIETGEREDICELLLTAARTAGLETDEDDITEEWRDW